MNAPKMVRPGVLLREAGLVKTDANGRTAEWKASVQVNSGQAYVYLHDSGDAATADAVRKIFAAKAAQHEGGIGRVYEGAEIRTLGGDPAAFLALEAAPGFQMGPGFSGEYVGPSIYKATHGYDPSRPEMRTSLLMIGPNVPHGTLVGARLVDIAPTIAGWLGLTMPDVDGKALQVTPASTTP